MMICTCGAKGQADAEAARLALASHLGVEASALAATVWASLHAHFGAAVHVGSDQWFGVLVRVDGYSESVECDHPLDGMIHLWGKLAEQFPDRVPPNADRVDVDLDALSQQQLQVVTDAENAWRAHHSICQEEDCTRHDRIACPVGKPLWARTWEVSTILTAKWGEPLPADEAAFYGKEEGPSEAGDAQANELIPPETT